MSQVLELVNHAIDSGTPFDGPEGSIDTPELRALLRRAAADVIVLLKNDKNLLPLSPNTKSIAVIGPNAKQAVISGGGSAELRPAYTVSPLEGITAAAKKLGTDVKYVTGANTHKFLPVLDSYISTNGKPGALIEFWNAPPTQDFLAGNSVVSAALPAPVWSTTTTSSNCFISDGIVSELPKVLYVGSETPLRRTSQRSTRSAGSG